MPKPFTPEERRALRADLLAGGISSCPRCGVPLDVRQVPPRRDVSYVRHRAWVVCPRCHGSAVLDRREVAP